MADSVSEADFSEEQGTGSTGTGNKASGLKKKERIRVSSGISPDISH